MVFRELVYLVVVVEREQKLSLCAGGWSSWKRAGGTCSSLWCAVDVLAPASSSSLPHVYFKSKPSVMSILPLVLFLYLKESGNGNVKNLI